MGDPLLKAMKVDEVRPGRPKLVTMSGREIVVFRIGTEFYAVDNNCPHQHFSKLHEGMVEGTVITCPMHGWSFDLKTGKCVTGDGRLTCHSIWVEGNNVMIDVPDNVP